MNEYDEIPSDKKLGFTTVKGIPKSGRIQFSSSPLTKQLGDMMQYMRVGDIVRVNFPSDLKPSRISQNSKNLSDRMAPKKFSVCVRGKEVYVKREQDLIPVNRRL